MEDYGMVWDTMQDTSWQKQYQEHTPRVYKWPTAENKQIEPEKVSAYY